MELPVKNVKGKVVGTANLSDAVFGVPMNSAVVHQAMVMYESNQRQGTHDTKTRAEVSGGGRKPWPQKHTGRARQGSIRSPQWRGGGVVFGPHPRDHGVDMPRRMRRLALKCVLSEKVRQDKVIILNELSFKSPSTKNMADILNKLGVASSALIVTGEPSRKYGSFDPESPEGLDIAGICTKRWAASQEGLRNPNRRRRQDCRAALGERQYQQDKHQESFRRKR